MTIYAKTWYPAYPCDPCLINTTGSTDNIGSGFNPSGYQAVYNYHESDNPYFLGLRKWGLFIDTVAAIFGLPETDPPQFCIPVGGTMANGTPLPLSNLTLTYGGSVVFSVSSPIQVMHRHPTGGYPNNDGHYPDGAFVEGFSGYIEVPSDGIIHLGPGASAWEWHYDGPFYPGQVTLEWFEPGERHSGTVGTATWVYDLSSSYGPESAGFSFYRTGVPEMPQPFRGYQKPRRRVPLVGRAI
jgi:hypothetical protein